MSKVPVLTSGAPKPLPGIYSQAIKAGGMVYCSGCVPMDPETMKLIDGDIQAHTVRPRPDSDMHGFAADGVVASMHQEPHSHLGCGRLEYQQRCQGQRLLGEYG